MTECIGDSGENGKCFELDLIGLKQYYYDKASGNLTRTEEPLIPVNLKFKIMQADFQKYYTGICTQIVTMTLIITLYQSSCKQLMEELKENRGLAQIISPIPVTISRAWKMFYLYQAFGFTMVGYGYHAQYSGITFLVFWILTRDEYNLLDQLVNA